MAAVKGQRSMKQNRGPEKYPQQSHKYSQLNFDKGEKTVKWRMLFVFSTSGSCFQSLEAHIQKLILQLTKKLFKTNHGLKF